MRVSEIYLSVQGEGPRVGTPTVFLRFGGCNLRCAGWPCDTQHAIQPEFRHEWLKKTPAEAAQEVLEVAKGFPVFNVCYTGGEPFLQSDHELEELTMLLHADKSVGIIECFSNGALSYPDWAPRYIHFVMDWKLPGSGEKSYVPARHDNVEAMREWGHAIKFTIASNDDYQYARALVDEYRLLGDFSIYAGVVWGKVTNEELVGWMLEDKLPWKHNVQVHNHIWDRQKRGI